METDDIKSNGQRHNKVGLFIGDSPHWGDNFCPKDVRGMSANGLIDGVSFYVGKDAKLWLKWYVTHGSPKARLT
jgi:hypothetical protein